MPLELSTFRRSSGWSRLDRTLAVSPTTSNVAEVRKRECRSCGLFAAIAAAIADSFSTRVSDSVAGSFRGVLGYANEARRYGRGMSSAVRASGKSSHELQACQRNFYPTALDCHFKDGSTGADSCTGEK